MDAENEIERLNKTKQAIDKEIGTFNENLEKIKQSVITHQEKLKSVQLEIDNIKNGNNTLQKISSNLRSANDELEKTYLANMAKARLFLSLNDDVASQYRALMSSLQIEYQRDSFDQHIMMSLFWKIYFSNHQAYYI